MTKEGAAAMASAAVETETSPRPTPPRPTEGDEEEEEEAADREGKNSEDDDYDDDSEEAEGGGGAKKRESLARVYDGTGVEPPEPKKKAKKRKRKSPDDGDGDGRYGSDVEGGEEGDDGGAASLPPMAKRKRGRPKKEEDDDPATGEVVSARPLSEKWLRMLGRARRIKERHGSLGVLDDDRTVDPEVSSWIREQRYYHSMRFHGREGKYKNKEAGRLARVMHDEKVRRLEEIGLDFEVMEAKESARERDWEENFDELKRFKDEHGHCNVPLSKKGQVPSYFQTWCRQQRIEYKNLRDGNKTKMTPEKMTRLKDVGFAFLARERYVNWDTRLEQVRAFVAENGHCNIPVEHPVLGEFTCKIRRHYKLHLDGKPNSITPRKIEQLNELGFVWLAGKRWLKKGPRKPWEERFQDLLEYKEAHGHTNVPQSYEGLGGWVKEQRKEYKKMVKGANTKMSAEKARKLSEMGFLFEVRMGAAGGATGATAAAANVGAGRADVGAKPD